MPSKVQDINAQLRYNTKQIYWLCGIDQAKLAVFMDSLLTDWLAMYFGDWDSETWKLSSLLLKWWTHNWCLRDDDFILNSVYKREPEGRLIVYRQMHQSIFHPGTTTAKYLQEDFRSLINDFTKEIIAAEKLKTHAIKPTT